MLGMIGAAGSSIGLNIISDQMKKRLERFKDDRNIAAFIQSLCDWEIEFEKQNDGTIITKEAFYTSVKYKGVIEETVRYVLEPNESAVTEEEYIKNLQWNIENSIIESSTTNVSVLDSKLIHKFLSELLGKTKGFLLNNASVQDRGIFYMICQNNAKIVQLEQTVKTQFQMQDQRFRQIYEILSQVDKEYETEESVKAKIASWNSRQIANLGNRYVPDLNIPVKIMESLHGASLDDIFQSTFYEKADNFLIAMRREHINELDRFCISVERLVSELDYFNISSNVIDALVSIIDCIEEFLNKRIEECYTQTEVNNNRDSEVYTLVRLQTINREFLSFLNSRIAKAAISPFLVLVGDGGVGKSHLIADYINTQSSIGNTSLLLLGQQISAEKEILSLLPSLLGCNLTFHELFGILESIAHNQNSRVLICIDALNEGAGTKYWNSVLGGIVDYLQAFPHIGLLVSVRTQYEERLFAGQETLRAQMQRIEHIGFTEVEYDAIYKYFSFYGISTDSVVFPSAEFRNPLFLRLFCTANKISISAWTTYLCFQFILSILKPLSNE